jgi:protein-L-isoaspartate(D-aspartate) O-methyltransferase
MKRMIEEQLIRRGIKDPRVLDAFSKVPRDRFVLPGQRKNAYSDHPLPIGEDQTISQPYIAALMTECLELTGRERVLEIGTGSGYQTAILAELAKEVYTIERFEKLFNKSNALFSAIGYNNIKTRLGDGSLGWPEEAPFDRIIITAFAESIPQPLVEQLREKGKLVLPLGDHGNQVLTTAEKIDNKIITKQICGCVFVPLVGKYGAQHHG